MVCVCMGVSMNIGAYIFHCRSTPDQYASLAGPCTVQRVNGSGFTQTDFESKYVSICMYLI